jgi:hypothetical protein
MSAKRFSLEPLLGRGIYSLKSLYWRKLSKSRLKLTSKRVYNGFSTGVIIAWLVYYRNGVQIIFSFGFELILFSISIKSTPSIIAMFGVRSWISTLPLSCVQRISFDSLMMFELRYYIVPRSYLFRKYSDCYISLTWSKLYANSWYTSIYIASAVGYLRLARHKYCRLFL